MPRFVPTGEMTEEVQFVTPPGKSGSGSHVYGQVNQEAGGTTGSTVWARFRVLGIEENIRAGGEASRDMANVDIHYTTEATERKALIRVSDSSRWNITSATRERDTDGFQRLVCTRSK